METVALAGIVEVPVNLAFLLTLILLVGYVIAVRTLDGREERIIDAVVLKLKSFFVENIGARGMASSQSPLTLDKRGQQIIESLSGDIKVIENNLSDKIQKRKPKNKADVHDASFAESPHLLQNNAFKDAINRVKYECGVNDIEILAAIAIHVRNAYIERNKENLKNE